MPVLAIIRTKLKKLELEKKNLRSQELIALRRTPIICAECGKGSHVRFWTFIQMNYYVQPHSCNEGDYWLPNDVETCHMDCPKCGADNYIYNHPHREKLIEFILTAGKHGHGRDALFMEVTQRNRNPVY